MGGFGLLATERPEAWRGFVTLVDRAWADPALPPGTLELCRLRMGQLLRSNRLEGLRLGALPEDFEQRAGRLPRWPEDAAFGALDRAVLSAAEQFLLDAHALDDDEEAGRLVDAVGAPGYAVLTVGLGLAESLLRAAAVLDVGPVDRRVSSLDDLVS